MRDVNTRPDADKSGQFVPLSLTTAMGYDLGRKVCH